MYQFTSDNKIVGYAAEPTYIKKLENGRYGLCAAYEAEGVVVGGKPYAIRELDDLPVAEIKAISDSEFFDFVMQSNAALAMLGVQTEEVTTDAE